MNLWKRLKVALFWSPNNQYDAAQWTQFRSWRSTPLQDARLDVTKLTREALQGKSRDFERNSPVYSKIADLWEQYIVGTGVQLKSASTDAAWALAADEDYNRWKPFADLQSRLGFDNLQGVIARSFFVDGEAFVLLTREGSFPRIQLIEAHRIKTPDSLAEKEGMSVIDGVAIDANGRPAGYYLCDKDGIRVIEAANMVHIYEPGRPGQYRGIPYCTAAIPILHDLHDLKGLEMRAAKDAAEMSTIIKTATGELPPALVDMAQKFRNKSTAAGSSSSTSETKRDYYMTATGGRNLVLQNGDDAEQFRPERPGTNTREYWRLLQEELCVCAGVPRSLVFSDTMQGTVYRGSIDSFAAFARCKTALLAGYFSRIRNYVIGFDAQNNRAIAKLPPDWDRVSAGTVRAPNVDVGRNSRAMLDEIAGGTRTFTSVAAELGCDGREILRQKADEAAYVRELATARGIDVSEITNLTVEKPGRDKEGDDATNEEDEDETE